MTLPHKDIELPMPDMSGDEGDPSWRGEMFEPIPERPGFSRWVRGPGVHAAFWEVISRGWESTVAAFEANPGTLSAAWLYLDEHPAFWEYDQAHGRHGTPPHHISRLLHDGGIRRCVDLDVVRVCPETLEIEDDPERNTLDRVWWETGKADLLPRQEHGVTIQAHWHDVTLDGAAPTLDEAVISLAQMIWDSWGNDRRVVDTVRWERGERGEDNLEEEPV